MHLKCQVGVGFLRFYARFQIMSLRIVIILIDQGENCQNGLVGEL